MMTKPPAESIGTGPESPRETEAIAARVGLVLRRRRRWLVVWVLVVVAAVVAYDEVTDPLYDATATVIFDELAEPTPAFDADVAREVHITNRLEEIKSEALAKEVVDTFSDATVQRWYKPDPRHPDPRAAVAQRLSESLLIAPVRDSNIAHLTVEMDDPVLAADAANALARVYQERSQRIKRQGVSGIRQFLEEQATRSQTELEASETALKEYKEKNRISSFDDQSREALRGLTDAQALHAEANAKREALTARLAEAYAILDAQRAGIVPSVTGAAPSWATRLRDRIIELQQQQAEARAQGYPPTHPKMVQITAEIDSMKASLTAEAQKIAQGQTVSDPIAHLEELGKQNAALEADLRSAGAEETALRKVVGNYEQSLASLPAREQELARLTRAREVNQAIHADLLKKLEETKISEAEKIPDMRVVDAAVPPEEPVRPRKVLNVVLALMFALISGTGLAFLRESVASSVDSTREIEQLTSWPVLAAIPRIPRISRAARGLMPRPSGDARQQRHLVTFFLPNSGPAEAYRMLRTNLQFRGLGTRWRTLLVTSAAPGDGKSTVVSNLAVAIASVGCNTLLVDAEIRRPMLHSVFEVAQDPGLSNVLMAPAEQWEVALAQANGRATSYAAPRGNVFDYPIIQKTPVQNLQIFPAGSSLHNSGDLLSMRSSEMGALLAHLRTRHDAIVLDCPPLSLVNDAAVLAGLVDAVLFVVSAERCDRELLLRCRRQLETSGAKVAGVVLNHVEPSAVYRSSPYYHEEG